MTHHSSPSCQMHDIFVTCHFIRFSCDISLVLEYLIYSCEQFMMCPYYDMHMTCEFRLMGMFQHRCDKFVTILWIAMPQKFHKMASLLIYYTHVIKQSTFHIESAKHFRSKCSQMKGIYFVNVVDQNFIK